MGTPAALGVGQGTSAHSLAAKHRLEFEPGLSCFQLSPQAGHLFRHAPSSVRSGRTQSRAEHQVRQACKELPGQRVWSTQTLTRVRY